MQKTQVDRCLLCFQIGQNGFDRRSKEAVDANGWNNGNNIYTITLTLLYNNGEI